MSKTHYIDYNFYNRLEWSAVSLRVIHSLLLNGWTYYNYYWQGRVRYIPLGDKDDCEWQDDMLKPEEVESLVVSKLAENEKVIIEFCKNEPRTGLTIFIWSDYKVSFNIDTDRIIFAEGVTDVTWYLIEFKRIFDSIDLTKYIESIEYKMY